MNKAQLLLICLFIPLCAFGGNFSFTGDSMTTVLARGKEKTVLSGNARVVSDEFTITADTVELFGKDYQYVQCSGHVRVEDSKNDMTITCERLFFDRQVKNTIAETNALMEDRRNEIIARGQRIESREDGKLVLIQVGVRILKKDLSARSEFARYNRELDMLELSGLPLVYWKQDEYRASRISIDLEKDEISLSGAVSGSVSSGGSEDD